MMQGVNIWISDLLSWIKRDGKVMEKDRERHPGIKERKRSEWVVQRKGRGTTSKGGGEVDLVLFQKNLRFPCFSSPATLMCT